jgi:hypothetical protein
MDATMRVRIVPDPYHDPSDVDRPADETAERVRLFATGELSAVGAIAERECPACGIWQQLDSLWGIEIGADEPYGPHDVITPGDIPLGPADPRPYGYATPETAPPNLAVPVTSSRSYLVQIAADLLTADIPTVDC